MAKGISVPALTEIPKWCDLVIERNKVTMQGRMMGCLEQVFIHDGFERPIFETYSEHAPCGYLKEILA